MHGAPLHPVSTCKNKEVSYAVMAAIGIDFGRNCGCQFFCWLNMAQTTRFRLAELPWRCDRRTDSGTCLGVFEADGAQKIICVVFTSDGLTEQAIIN